MGVSSTSLIFRWIVLIFFVFNVSFTAFLITDFGKLSGNFHADSDPMKNTYFLIFVLSYLSPLHADTAQSHKMTTSKRDSTAVPNFTKIVVGAMSGKDDSFKNGFFPTGKKN